jgi:hypothetical protein
VANLNDIVTVNIDLASPAVDSASFDNLLIVGPPPILGPTNLLPTVGVYSDLEEVTAAGYAATGDSADPVGIAARIAFSQNPKPARIYVAAQRDATPLITDGDVKIITAANALTDALPIGTIDGNTANNLPWVQVTYNRLAVSSMEVEISKDGISRFGNSLPTTANPDAMLQVCISNAPNPGDDTMGITPGEEDGQYTVMLIAKRGQRKTVMALNVTFDGINYTVEDITTTTTPQLQTPVETLSDALGTDGWYVICAAGIPESGYEEIAEWTEAQTKIFAYTFLSQSDPVGAIYYRSFGVCGLVNDLDLPTDVPTANAYLHVAMTAKCLSYSSGSETWAFKQLAAVYPSDISTTLRMALTEDSSNFFAQYAGRNITMNGKVRANEWIDIIRGRDWLQNDMRLRIYNLLILNPKIPYTNSGIAKVQNEMIASLKAAQTRGIVAENEYDENGELVLGFVTSVPNSQSLTATQKASRILRDCKFSARLAGAIHVVNVSGALTY